MKLDCRNCGYPVEEWEVVKAAVKAEYNYTDEELDGGDIVVRVYHPDCAVSDGRIDDIDDLDGAPFYWDAYRSRS